MLATPGNELELNPNQWIISQAKFPELESNVLSCISCSSIFSNKHFIGCAAAFLRLYFSFTKRQYPAACQRAGFWLLYQAAFSQHLKDVFPKSCTQNS